MSRTSSTSESRAAESADLTKLVGVKLGNYRLERLLGHGKMGVVYLANDEALLRPTAIKVLSWSAAEARGHDPVQWFLAEARMVARINHPRVVQIYGAARHGGYCYIAMEYVPGQSAEAMVTHGRVMTPELATDVLIQAASALHAAHGSGVVHRDVKPANLLVGAGGVTKLGDFGMALCPADDQSGNARLRVGTPYYTAPELWRGDAATAASDIYSLGATYFHLLTARPPYPGRDVQAVEQAHLHAGIPDPRQFVPRLPDSCAALIQRALAKDPLERHTSAQVLLWEGRRVLQDLACAGGAPATGRGVSSATAETERHDVVQPPLPPIPPATGLLAEVLGFVRRPFCGIDVCECPYEGEPIASLRRRILERIDDEATPILAVTGSKESGRSMLCRRVIADAGATRLVLTAELSHEADERSLIQRLCRAAGVVEESSEEGALDALVQRLSEERQRRRKTPLLVLDGLTTTKPSTAGLSSLIGAGLWTRSFKLLLCGAPGFLDHLARDGVDLGPQRVPEIPVQPLDRQQLPQYVRSWLDATLAPRAPPVIVTPDALVVLALRSEGALEWVDCIAENMLLLAAAEQRRTVSTWHAWAASRSDRWFGKRAPAVLPRRPAGWPLPEVSAAIDAYRRRGAALAASRPSAGTSLGAGGSSQGDGRIPGGKAPLDLALVAQLPGVNRAVMGDLAGAFVDAVREQDGESVAAVMGLLSSTMSKTGEQLGLGALRRICVAGEARACLVSVQGSSVITAYVEQPKSLPSVEKVLDSSLHGKG